MSFDFVLLLCELDVLSDMRMGFAGWHQKYVDRRREVRRTSHSCMVWCNWMDCDRKTFEGADELGWEFNREVGLNSRRSLSFIENLTGLSSTSL